MAFIEAKASSSRPKTPKGGRGRGGKASAPGRVKTNQAKRNRINDELRELRTKVETFEPPAELTSFTQLPLSEPTLKGLKASHFVNPTPIQALAIPPALRARDVLGSARTGSGKTLAFLIPMLERLYALRWGAMDGLGAVVISPTRELAVQTFNALRDIGRFHMFSAGLVIGGKPLKEERDRLARMNILICTPGRLLQHLDSTVGFESAGVKVLVLDEADRLLDMGFLPALRAIVEHFSPSATARADRQTLLFSATQSKDISALAKLSLHDPLYINCNKPGEEGVMPSNLEQFYAVVPLERKLDALWGFIKSHLKMKGVVFVTTGKQVRFVFETFRRMHPGLPLMHLHGKQKQATRMAIFDKFSSANHALLICTDIAARGLDFPAVDWVIQLDCPDDVDAYIHRVGRTARYDSEGKGLCLLCPSEEKGMLARWGEKGIDVKRIKIKESKMSSLEQQMQNLCFKDTEVKYLGQRAFISYMRAIHIQKDKTVFKLDEYPAEAFAASMGLPGAPQIKFIDEGKKAKTRGPAAAAASPTIIHQRLASDSEGGTEGEDSESEASEESDAEGSRSGSESSDGSEGVSDGESASGSGSENEDVPRKAPAVRTKYDRMFERKNQSILTDHYNKLVAHDEDDDGDEVFTLARRDHDLEGDEDDDGGEGGALTSSADLSKRKLKDAATRKGQLKHRGVPTKLVFGEDGEARDFYAHGDEAEDAARGDEVRQAYVAAEAARMREADVVDRAVAREKRREKKRKRKEAERRMREEFMGEGEEPVAFLGSDGGASDGEGDYAPSPSPSAEPEPSRPAKKRREDVDDDEELALRLLRGE